MQGMVNPLTTSEYYAAGQGSVAVVTFERFRSVTAAASQACLSPPLLKLLRPTWTP
jgi:hypothetical protein